jgi:hypothetical protein
MPDLMVTHGIVNPPRGDAVHYVLEKARRCASDLWITPTIALKGQ